MRTYIFLWGVTHYFWSQIRAVRVVSLAFAALPAMYEMEYRNGHNKISLDKNSNLLIIQDWLGRNLWSHNATSNSSDEAVWKYRKLLVAWQCPKIAAESAAALLLHFTATNSRIRHKQHAAPGFSESCVPSHTNKTWTAVCVACSTCSTVQPQEHFTSYSCILGNCSTCSLQGRMAHKSLCSAYWQFLSLPENCCKLLISSACQWMPAWRNQFSSLEAHSIAPSSTQQQALYEPGRLRCCVGTLMKCWWAKRAVYRFIPGE